MKTWTSSAAIGGPLACFGDSPLITPTPLAIGTVVDRAGRSGTAPSRDPFSTIVVGVDHDMDQVIAQARQRVVAGRTRLVLVHAQPDRPTGRIRRRRVTASPDRLERRAAAATAALRRLGVAADYTLRPGRPAEVLAEAARDLGAETIVIGSRPPRAGRRNVGRVARALDRVAPCRVVLVAQGHPQT
jgi:nucleotide-binding universal stress UspA family protein